MSLFDLPSVLLVGLGLLFAALSGHFTRASLTVMDAVVLPVGLAGTFIGFLCMLQQMAGPAEALLTFAVAMLTSLYAAFFKICLQVRLSGEVRPAPEHPGVRGRVAAALFLALLAGRIGLDAPLFSFLMVKPCLIFGGTVGVIAGMARVAGHRSIVATLIRFLPSAGLFLLYASIVALVPALDHPPNMGPIMAWGLLGHLYANVLSIVLHLTYPHRVDSPPATTQWLTFGAALIGVLLQMGLLYSIY